MPGPARNPYKHSYGLCFGLSDETPYVGQDVPEGVSGFGL